MEVVCDLCGKFFPTAQVGNREVPALCRDCHERGQLWAAIQAYKVVSGIDMHKVLDKFDKALSKEGK